jgi:hypothetical protein
LRLTAMYRRRQIAFAWRFKSADLDGRNTYSPPDFAKTMNKDTFRVVTRGADGEIRIRDYDNAEALLKRHSQIGIDDCSTDLGLRGLPVFRGLIGPIPEGKNIIRYETPEVFETLTKEWSNTRPVRRRRTRVHTAHSSS